MRILIIEDNMDLCASIADYLETKGEVIDFAYDGQAGYELSTKNEYDIIILDINLPKINGIELCERIRHEESKPKPIIMLTAHGELDTKLKCYDKGADDYLVKPFEMAELYARLKALHKRYSNQSKVLVIGDLVYDTQSEIIQREGITIKLPLFSAKLLKVLMQHSPSIVSRETLENTLWNENAPDDDVLKIHIHTLRKKIDMPFKKSYLKTIRGRGYLISNENK